jgi:hypothetical protein
LSRNFSFSEKIFKKFCENEKFWHKLLRKRTFSRKLAHFRLIFAFRENEKIRFRFNPTYIVYSARGQ